MHRFSLSPFRSPFNRFSSLAFAVLVGATLLGCPPQSQTDAGPSNVDDAGSGFIAADDGGRVFDAGVGTNAGTDAGAPLDAGDALGDHGAANGFGAISGDCGLLGAELQDAAPSLFSNHLDFGTDPYDAPDDLDQLTEGGQEMIAVGNAGGSSVLSEVFSYEVLQRCEGAQLLKTETEVLYDGPGKITDLLVEIGGQKIGVSVTRAVGFPRDAPYTVEQARTLMERKLSDILDSSAHVSAADAWVKQVLHVVAYADQHAQAMQEAWTQIPAEIRADTIVVITTTDGDDAFIY